MRLSVLPSYAALSLTLLIGHHLRHSSIQRARCSQPGQQTSKTSKSPVCCYRGRLEVSSRVSGRLSIPSHLNHRHPQRVYWLRPRKRKLFQHSKVIGRTTVTGTMPTENLACNSSIYSSELEIEDCRETTLLPHHSIASYGTVRISNLVAS